MIDSGAIVLAGRVAGFVATIFGMVIFSMLILFITTRVESSICNFRRGRSDAIEERDFRVVLVEDEL